MRKVSKRKIGFFVVLFCAVFALFSFAPTYTVSALSPQIIVSSSEKELVKNESSSTSQDLGSFDVSSNLESTQDLKFDDTNNSTIQELSSALNSNYDTLTTITDFNTQKLALLDITNYDLEDEYSLYSFTGYTGESENLPSNIGNQYNTDLCWAFATNTALESTIYKLGLSADETLNFSEVDMAYYVYILSRNRNNIGSGGFELGFEYLSSERGPVIENALEAYGNNGLRWDSNSALTSSYAEMLSNYSPVHSGYSVMEAVSFPSRQVILHNANVENEDEETTQGKVLNLRNMIKNHIKTYGAVTTSIYFDGAYLANSYVYCYTGNNAVNHMVTLVGWDDDFRNGNRVGAYIAQNSYGSSFGRNGYFYIMYEDVNVENDVMGFTRVGEVLDNKTTYNSTEMSQKCDQFVTISGSSSYTTQFVTVSDTSLFTANIFKTKAQNQTVTRLKVPTVSAVSQNTNSSLYESNNNSTNFKVYLLKLSTSDVLSYDSALKNNFNDKIPIKNKNATWEDEYLFTSTQTGYYTIEIDEGVTIDCDYFAIIIETLPGGSVLYISNNEDGGVSIPTYMSFYPSSSWSRYASGGEECVLPMIVESVNLANIEYSVKDVTKEYSGEVVLPDVSVYNLDDYVITYSLDGQDYFSESEYNVKDVLRLEDGEVGSYTVFVRISSSYYSTIETSTTVTILPRDLVITPNSGLSKYYGDEEKILTYTLSGLLEGEYPTTFGRLSRVLGEDVGTYEITIGNFELLSSNTFSVNNYEISFKSGVMLTIAPRELVIEVTANSKFYGDDDPEFAYIIANTLPNETPNVEATIVRTSGEDAGSYEFNFADTVKINDNGDFKASNYIVTLNTNIKFVIQPRPLYIVPTSNQTKVYGEEDGTFSFSYSNNLSEEEPVFTGALSREKGEDVGNYLITLGDLNIINNGTFKADNYTLVLDDEVYFYISHGEITGANAIDSTTTYDGEGHGIEVTLSEGVSVYYRLKGEEEYRAQPISLKNVGTYQIEVLFTKENYYDLTKTVTLTINKRDIIVSPLQNQSKIYGDNDNILFTYSGVITNETPAFTGSLSRATGQNVGTYLINVGSLMLTNGENFDKNNYNLVFASENNIVYTITKRDLVITPEHKTKTYGTLDPNLTFTYSRLYYSDQLSFTGNLTRNAGENVGEYQINLGSLKLSSVLSTNYNLVFAASPVYFEILPADITITIHDKEAYYGEIDTNYTYSITGGYIGGDNLNLKFSCIDSTGHEINNESLRDLNGYNITATYSNNNYNATIIPGKYYILYRTYTVTFKGFNEALSTLNNIEHFMTVSELPEGLSTSVSGYEFLGWMVEGENDIVDVFSYPIVENTTFVSQFKPIEYNITYVLNGGAFMNTDAPTTYNIESSFTLPSPVRTGYNFIGFYESADFSGDKVLTLKGKTGDKTLYAKFDIIVFDVVPPVQNDMYVVLGNSNIEFGEDYVFTVMLNEKYDKSYSSIRAYATYVENGERIELERVDDLIRQTRSAKTTGVNFVLRDVKGEFDIELENITLNVYDIDFVIDNEIVKTVNISHGDALILSEYPSIPTKEHYDDTLPYWSTAEGVDEVTDDMQINAIYTPNVYNVTFVLGENSYNTTVRYGEDVNTSVLYDNYKLALFEYFTFDRSLSGVDGDTTIYVTINSNIYILYIVLGIVGAIIITLIILSIVRRKKRNKFDWWVFGK